MKVDSSSQTAGSYQTMCGREFGGHHIVGMRNGSTEFVQFGGKASRTIVRQIAQFGTVAIETQQSKAKFVRRTDQTTTGREAKFFDESRANVQLFQVVGDSRQIGINFRGDRSGFDSFERRVRIQDGGMCPSIQRPGTDDNQRTHVDFIFIRIEWRLVRIDA